MEFEEDIQKEYEAFLQETLHNKEIWILQSDEGLACQSSMEYEDQMAILIWANGVLAESERDGEFEELEAVSLPLGEFVMEWLTNMHEVQVICGLNWKAEIGGIEVEPKDLLEHYKLIIPDDIYKEFQSQFKD